MGGGGIGGGRLPIQNKLPRYQNVKSFARTVSEYHA